VDSGTWGYTRDDIRVSDADRDQAVAELSEHFQTGRLTQDEFDDRSGRALQARTGADLSGLFTDLPRSQAVATPAAWQADTGPVDTEQLDTAPVPRRRHPARSVIALVVALIVISNLFSNGHGHGLGWLVPVVALLLVFVRIGHHQHRR
jgi:Domain of unknown function (DUF1707)